MRHLIQTSGYQRQDGKVSAELTRDGTWIVKALDGLVYFWNRAEKKWDLARLIVLERVEAPVRYRYPAEYRCTEEEVIELLETLEVVLP